VLLLGIAVQCFWMNRKPAPMEWPLPGYPGAYHQQLKLKSGNYPELGMAKFADLPARVATNLMIEAELLVTLSRPQGVNRTEVAVVIIRVILMGVGWAYSVWKSRGTSIVDWYFAGYECIYLLWPWTMEVRFLLPIGPLAFFYTWQGIVGIVRSSLAKPRLVGNVWFPAALLMTALSARSIHKHWALGKTDVSDVLMLQVWLISAGCAVWMAYTGHPIF